MFEGYTLIGPKRDESLRHGLFAMYWREQRHYYELLDRLNAVRQEINERTEIANAIDRLLDAATPAQRGSEEVSGETG